MLSEGSITGKRFKQIKWEDVRSILLLPVFGLAQIVEGLDVLPQKEARILAFRRIFYFVFGISPNTRVPAEEVTSLREWLLQRFVLLGRRSSSIILGPDGLPNWTFGAFQLCHTEGHPAVRHIAGTLMILPQAFVDAAGLHVKKNWSDLKATLVDEREVLCLDLGRFFEISSVLPSFSGDPMTEEVVEEEHVQGTQDASSSGEAARWLNGR